MDKKTFEQCIARIQEITGLLSEAETPLEDSIRLYQEASGLLMEARQILCDAEVEITRITAEATPDD